LKSLTIHYMLGCMDLEHISCCCYLLQSPQHRYNMSGSFLFSVAPVITQKLIN
jgi:hypothetical protein